MLRYQYLLLLGLLILCAQTAGAAVIHVPQDYETIQAAIDAATDGDEIIVAEGTYSRVDFKGKNVNLHSTDPTDWEVVRKTIIRPSVTGFSRGSAVIFNGSENSSCRLAGFTITGGRFYNEMNQLRYSNGSGIFGYSSRATIEYNYIVGNSALGRVPNVFIRIGGGGISSCDGIIQNNIIDANEANMGGGISNCHGIIQNNIITRNRAEPLAPWYSHYNIDAPGIGGALYNCGGIIQFNTIINNIIVETVVTSIKSGGLLRCKGVIENNIIWHTEPSYQEVEFVNSSVPQYCIIKGWTGGGEGNIDEDPLLNHVVWQLAPEAGELIEQDYRLHPESPAIDAGRSTESLTMDFEGEPRGFDWPLRESGDGAHWDIGADEFTAGKLTLWLRGRPMALERGTPARLGVLLGAGAGTTMRFTLEREGEAVAELGQFGTSAIGEATETSVELPENLAPGEGYVIVARSNADETTVSRTHPFAIFEVKSHATENWRMYGN